MKATTPPGLILALGATIVFWASSFAGIGAGLKSYNPAHLTLLRFATASLMFAGFAIFSRPQMPRRQDLPAILFLALIGIVAYHLTLGYGQLTVSAGAAGTLSNTSPIFTALMGTAFLGERLRPAAWMGICVSFLGAGLIAFGEGDAFQINWGTFLVFVAALCWGIYFTAQKPYLARYTAFELISYVVWVGTLLLLVFLPGLYAAVRSASAEATLSVVYLGVFPTAVAYVTWAYVLSRLPVSFAAGFLYLVPVLAFIIAWIWLGEVPNILTLTGGAIAILGVAILNLKGRADTGR